MSRDETPLSWLSPKTAVRPSPIQGKGLFATAPIDRDEIVCIKGGYVLPAAAWQASEPTLGSCETQICRDFFIAPTGQAQREGSMLYSNHSCAPNIAPQGQIVFVAMRDITAGEELCHGWATTDDLGEEIACNCGAAECRGVVTGQDWRLPALQKKYAGYFAWHVQRRIDAAQAD